MIKKISALCVVSILVTFAQAREVVDNIGNCNINWTQGYITCSSESARDQSKFAAKLSAKVIARRDLLEVVKCVQISSEMTIEDGLITSDIIKSRVQGVIKGSQIVSNNYDSKTKSAIATAKIVMGKDLLTALLSDPTKLSWNEKINSIFDNFSIFTKAYADTLYNRQDIKTLKKLLEDLRKLDDKKSVKYVETILSKLSDTKYSGILIDVSELINFKKAMIVKLVDKNGKEIYPAKKLSKKVLTKRNTSVGYMYSLDDARQNKRVFDTPLELKVSTVYKNKKSNIVLSDEQILSINELGSDIFSKAKIILVLGE